MCLRGQKDSGAKSNGDRSPVRRPGRHRRDAIAGYIPRLVVCLHEDYDAQGLYAYELNRHASPRPAEYCLTTARNILARDPRRIIEGRPYQSMSDLRRVPGIGEKTLEKLTPFLKIQDQPDKP